MILYLKDPMIFLDFFSYKVGPQLIKFNTLSALGAIGVFFSCIVNPSGSRNV